MISYTSQKTTIQECYETKIMSWETAIDLK
jgi:hypothetical protein